MNLQRILPRIAKKYYQAYRSDNSLSFNSHIFRLLAIIAFFLAPYTLIPNLSYASIQEAYWTVNGTRITTDTSLPENNEICLVAETTGQETISFDISYFKVTRKVAGISRCTGSNFTCQEYAL